MRSVPFLRTQGPGLAGTRQGWVPQDGSCTGLAQWVFGPRHPPLLDYRLRQAPESRTAGGIGADRGEAGRHLATLSREEPVLRPENSEIAMPCHPHNAH